MMMVGVWGEAKEVGGGEWGAACSTLTRFHAWIKGSHPAAKRVTDFVVKTEVVVDAVTSEQDKNKTN